MARSRRGSPKLRLHKATGKGRVILSGQHFYTHAPFDTPEAHEEYLQLLREWQERGCQPLGVSAEADTIAVLAQDYLKHIDRVGLYRKHGKPTSQRGLIEVALRELVGGFAPTDLKSGRSYGGFGELRVDEFTKAQVIQHRDALLERATLSVRGVNRKLGLLKSFLGWAADRGRFPEELVLPIERLKSLKAPARARRQPVPREDILAVATKLSPTLSAMLKVQYATGMRPGEICAMRWKDIEKCPQDPEARELGLWLYVVPSPKNEHHDGVELTAYWLNADCQALLSPFRKPPLAPVFAPKDTLGQRWPGGAKGLVAQATDAYTNVSYRQAIERGCKAARVPVFTPHQVRHRVITEIANDPSLGLAAACEAANHRSRETTLGYVHRDASLGLRVAMSRAKSRV